MSKISHYNFSLYYCWIKTAEWLICHVSWLWWYGSIDSILPSLIEDILPMLGRFGAQLSKVSDSAPSVLVRVNSWPKHSLERLQLFFLIYFIPTLYYLVSVSTRRKLLKESMASVGRNGRGSLCGKYFNAENHCSVSHNCSVYCVLQISSPSIFLLVFFNFISFHISCITLCVANLFRIFLKVCLLTVYNCGSIMW